MALDRELLAPVSRPHLPTRRVPAPRVAIALAAVSCVLAVAGCGTSGSPSSAAGTGNGDALAIKFADCMRSHGVPSFADPGSDQGGPGPGSGIDQQAPAFQRAEATCNKLQPGGQPRGTPATEAQRDAALAWARCIRRHGVPNWPDPTFPSTGGMFVAGGPGLNPRSPAVQHARAECGRP